MKAELLQCPRCGVSPLAETKGSLGSYECPGCKTKFPSLEGVPALFADPAAWRAEWAAALELFLHASQVEEQLHSTEIARADILDETRERLRRMLQAKQKTRQTVEKLLAPLKAAPGSIPLQSLLLQSGSKPLLYHYANILRDWSWGDEENRLSLELVLRATPSVGKAAKVLVIGSGAARLSVDLHERWKPALTVALDYNPLLVLAAKKILAGARLDLFEFPQAPVSQESFAVLCGCATDARPGPDFQLLFADARKAPFVKGAFDSVVTPWFIDVNGEDPRVFFPRLNALLPVGGKWICFGPLGFVERSPSRQYGLAEVLAIAREAGFAVSDSDVHEAVIPYMDSQDSRQRRTEKLVVFSTTKQKDVSFREVATGPAWATDPSLPVELRQEFVEALQAHQWNFAVLSQLDGRRSLDEICMNLAQQTRMDPTFIREMVKRLLLGIVR